MSMIRTVASDAAKITRACGPVIGSRWLAGIGFNWRSCLAARNLQPADRALGRGPFHARLGPARALLVGDNAFSGLREIWARDVYLGGGFLKIPPQATVLDLGANVGNFTLLALGHGPDVRVVSVEANAEMCECDLPGNLRANGWEHRANIINAFVGGQTRVQDDMIRRNLDRVAPSLSEAALIGAAGLTRIDLLKCDIEGSEFELLTPTSALLAMTSQLAIELHSWAGKPSEFIAMLRQLGFETRITVDTPEATVVLAKRT
jgi:FkbM family methyltransferase